MTIMVGLKWVATNVIVDPLDGQVACDTRSWGSSPADIAAFELAMQIAERRSDEVTAVCVGPAAADVMLRKAVSLGATQALRVELGNWATADSAEVARLLAEVAADTSVVVCGDHSLDRGSGATPAFLAAELGIPQILGVTELEFGEPTIAKRRTDRGGHDQLTVPDRCVLSVAGSLAIDRSPARSRRASLPVLLTAESATIELHNGKANATITGEQRPFRPRPRILPWPNPNASPLERIVTLTDAVSERTPPRTVRADGPDEAADAIIEQLQSWGYLDEPEAPATQ